MSISRDTETTKQTIVHITGDRIESYAKTKETITVHGNLETLTKAAKLLGEKCIGYDKRKTLLRFHTTTEVYENVKTELEKIINAQPL